MYTSRYKVEDNCKMSFADAFFDTTDSVLKAFWHYSDIILKLSGIILTLL